MEPIKAKTKTNKLEVDVFIKHEGYAAIKFLTDKSKQWAHDSKVPNSLNEFGDTFCGQPVWNPNTKKGLYTIGVKVSKLKSVVASMKKANLVIESEFDLRYV